MSCDIGELNRVAVLSAYDDLAALKSDRNATLRSADPYGVSSYLRGIETSSFENMGFAADIKSGDYGPFYEIRTYEILNDTFAQSEAYWAKVFERAETVMKPLMVMVSVETHQTCIAQIWPYRNLDDRVKMRTRARKLGYWPPPGGTGHLSWLRSEIFVSLPISPLR